MSLGDKKLQEALDRQEDYYASILADLKGEMKKPEIIEKKEADVRAGMLIYLIKNKLIKI